MVPFVGDSVAGLARFSTTFKLCDSACTSVSYANVKQQYTTVVSRGSQPSTVLRAELLRAGVDVPPTTPNITNWQAHLIVPFGN